MQVLSIDSLAKARRKLEDWLMRTSPPDAATLADRLLVRSRMLDTPEARADVERILARPERVHAMVQAAVAAPQPDPIVLSVLVCVLRDLDDHDLAEEVLGLIGGAVREATARFDVTAEPVRTVFYHWAHKAGLAELPATSGALSTHPLARIWYQLQGLLAATDHGRQIVTVLGNSPLRPNLGYHGTMMQHPELASNAELVAQALFVEVMIRPRRESVVNDLLFSILAAIDDGDPLDLGAPAPLDAVHRAACVASMALHRLMVTS